MYLLEKIIFLVNLTFAVYISSSDYTPDFWSQERRFSGVLALCSLPTGTESEITTWSIPMFSIGAAKACVALWTVSGAAL